MVGSDGKAVYSGIKGVTLPRQERQTEKVPCFVVALKGLSIQKY